jgi:hypothetical protein
MNTIRTLSFALLLSCLSFLKIPALDCVPKVQSALRELPEKTLGDLGIPVLHGFSSPTVETRDGCIPATIMIKEMLTTK